MRHCPPSHSFRRRLCLPNSERNTGQLSIRPMGPIPGQFLSCRLAVRAPHWSRKEAHGHAKLWRSGRSPAYIAAEVVSLGCTADIRSAPTAPQRQHPLEAYETLMHWGLPWPAAVGWLRITQISQNDHDKLQTKRTRLSEGQGARHAIHSRRARRFAQHHPAHSTRHII